MATVLFLTTSGGRRYARKIGKKLNVMGYHYYISTAFDYPAVHDRHPSLTPKNTIIHPRVAYPYDYGWMLSLLNKEKEGYRVINSVDTIRLTADKLRSGLLFNQLNISHPNTILVKNNTAVDVYNKLDDGNYVVKPLTSMSQGSHVCKFSKPFNSVFEFQRMVNNVPGNVKFIQSFVNALSLHRVIVLDGVSLPFSFVDSYADRAEDYPDWKLSVCLNKKTMRYVPALNADMGSLAEKAQKAVNGVINFVDIFETEDNGYVISEINTACNLTIHERLSGYDIAGAIATTLAKHF